MRPSDSVADVVDAEIAWGPAEVRGRAERTLARARRSLGVVDDRPLTGLDEALLAVEHLLGLGRARMRELAAGRPGPGPPPQRIASLAESLLLLGDLRDELRELSIAPRLHERPRMRASLARLQRIEGARALREAVPAEARRACGFARALLTSVEEGWWVPVAADPAAWVPETRVSLKELAPEETLVENGIPALVDRQAVAPVRVEGRVAGILYGDHGPSGRPADDVDRDVLAAFAEAVGTLYERAVLVERLSAQREEARRAFAEVEAILGEIAETGVDIAGAAPRVRTAPSRPATAPPTAFQIEDADDLLTFRQRQVLALMASGATTARISDELLISETTVKTHVKHIMSRLSARTRAEAVSRYLTLLAERRTGDA